MQPVIVTFCLHPPLCGTSPTPDPDRADGGLGTSKHRKCWEEGHTGSVRLRSVFSSSPRSQSALVRCGCLVFPRSVPFDARALNTFRNSAHTAAEGQRTRKNRMEHNSLSFEWILPSSEGSAASTRRWDVFGSCWPCNTEYHPHTCHIPLGPFGVLKNPPTKLETVLSILEQTFSASKVEQPRKQWTPGPH